jgi:hypothetical protein
MAMNSIPSSRDASNGPDVKTKFLSLVLFAAAVPTAMFAADAKSSITAIRCLTAEPKTGLPCEFGIDLAASYDEARRLRCSFFVARGIGAGRRLIGEFWPGPGCSGAQFGPDLVTGEGFSARFPRNFGFLGGARKRLQLPASQQYSGACRLGGLSGVAGP